MSQIQIFLQVEGNRRIELIKLDADALGHELLAAAIRLGFTEHDAANAHIFCAEHDEPLKHDMPLSKQGIGNKHRIHVHRCRSIEVTLHFNDVVKEIKFPPSATVAAAKKRFVHDIRMSPVDATEHVLQLCGCDERPEPDTQIGTLVNHCCSLCFNLVPIKRVEG